MIKLRGHSIHNTLYEHINRALEKDAVSLSNINPTEQFINLKSPVIQEFHIL